MFHDLLIKRGEDSMEYICFGVFNPQTGRTMNLTPDKIKICQELNLSYE